MEYTKHRQYLLNQLILVLGAWKAQGENDASLEQEFMNLLKALHPNTQTAISILEKHMEMEVAA